MAEQIITLGIGGAPATLTPFITTGLEIGAATSRANLVLGSGLIYGAARQGSVGGAGPDGAVESPARTGAVTSPDRAGAVHSPARGNIRS